MIEVTTEDIVVDIVNNIDVSSTGNIDVVVEDNNELDITVAKKEFVITGDDIYVPVLYDDVPQWMKDLVSLSVNQAIEGVSTSNLDQLNSMLAEFATSYVPLNQYTESILDLSNADVSLHALIETLNSTYEDGINSANSQIITLESTKASKDEVVTQVIETINSQLIDGTSDIGATIARLDQAIVSSNQSSALSYQAIISTLESMDGSISGNAAAINTVGSYVGVVDGVVTGTGLLADVAILQKQNDGIIETTSGTYKVMLNPQDPNTAQLVTTAEPYASWKASETPGSMDRRLAHIGDVYIEYVSTANGMKEYVASYKFIRTTVDNTSPYATDTEGFTWALVIDQAAQDAYQQALNAYDLADNKRRVFVTTPVLPYDVGDLWIDSTGTYAVVKHWTGSAWLVADRQVTEFANTVYTPTINNLQSQVDAKIEYWFQTTDPKTAWTTAALRLAHNGDVWYNTGSKVSQYYSNVTDSWSVISDKDALDAITAAEAARQLADSKVEVRYGTSAQRDATSNSWTAAEKTSNIGDLWIISDAGVDQNKQFRWNGTGWLDIRDNKIIANANAITQLSTDLQSGTGTWATADSVVSNTLSSSIAENRVEVEAKWSYDNTININGTSYNSGFGLATNVHSNSIPVGQSEFWIRADKFKVSNATNANYQPFTISNNNVVFNGKVTFNNGQVGTIDEAIATVVETVSVGDKNINITDNLIPVTSLVADTDNSGYQFIGTPTKSNATGIDSFAEAQIVLDGTDEVYSPYVDEVTIPYYFRIGISGVTSLSNIKICTINGSNVVTYGTLTYTLNAGQSLAGGNWYIIDGIINPVGGSTQAEGSIRLADGTKIGTINNYVIPSGTTKIVLGLVASCVISRMKLAKITADTLTGSYVTQGYVDNSLSSLGDMAFVDTVEKAKLGTTVVEGGYIKSDLLTANNIVTGSMSANRLTSTTGSSTVWTGGGLVSSNFNGGVSGNIGNPTAGFRLSSNAAGTSTDPNIYGAYIKGGIVDTSALAIGALKVVNSYGNTGALMFSENASFNGYTDDVSMYLSRIYSPSYGNGYIKNRLCTFNTPILLDGTVFIDVETITVYVDVRYNDGGWGTIYQVSQVGNGNTGITLAYTYIPYNVVWNYLDIRFRAVGHTSRLGMCKYLVINGA